MARQRDSRAPKPILHQDFALRSLNCVLPAVPAQFAMAARKKAAPEGAASQTGRKSQSQSAIPLRFPHFGSYWLTKSFSSAIYCAIVHKSSFLREFSHVRLFALSFPCAVYYAIKRQTGDKR
jgi:hypothetical protein